jgi:hypothetical protein
MYPKSSWDAARANLPPTTKRMKLEISTGGKNADVAGLMLSNVLSVPGLMDVK